MGATPCSAWARRIKIVAWLPDDPYPVADVEDWPDEDVAEGADDQSDLAAMVVAVHRDVRRAVALAVELGGTTTDPTGDISADPLLASYHLSTLAPLGPADRYRLLGARVLRPDSRSSPNCCGMPSSRCSSAC